VVLRTRRLTLRPFRLDDVAAIEAFAHDEAYLRHLRDHPGPEQFVSNNLAVDGAWIIEEDGRVVGSIFLVDELACLLDPKVHRQGIAFEAATAVIDDAFDRRDYREIVARADADNIASHHVLTRLSFTQRDDESFCLRRSDWRRRNDPVPRDSRS
jgi:RimJ/RimL family protein N-acetyltransferase